MRAAVRFLVASFTLNILVSGALFHGNISLGLRAAMVFILKVYFNVDQMLLYTDLIEIHQNCRIARAVLYMMKMGNHVYIQMEPVLFPRTWLSSVLQMSIKERSIVIEILRYIISS